jgi:hypothetical protein
MTFNAALFNSIQLCLPIESEIQAEAWQQSRRFATAAAQWNAYLNQLCLQTLLPYLREDAPQANISPGAALNWELVNGSAIAWDKRLVLVPTETIDLDEIRIPQEWVDIPSWAADYYLAVQVNPDESWVRVAGFVTHQQLKQKAQLDHNDRMYCLDEADLIPDLSVLWLSQKLGAEMGFSEVTRAAVPETTPLSASEAANLIQRLGNPALVNPRLAVPFERWAALLNHGGWRQRLSEQRQGIPERQSPRQWLQAGIVALGEAARNWSLVEYQMSTASRGSEAVTPNAALSRQLTVAQQRYELQVIPIDLEANSWRFELSRLTPAALIPAGVTLRLLSEDLQPFEGNEDRAMAAVERLYVEVMLEPGEALVWEIDPTPADYDQELLRF